MLIKIGMLGMPNKADVVEDYYSTHQGLPSVCEFSAFRHFFKTKVAQSVAELVLYCQTTRNVITSCQIWRTKTKI